LVQLVQRQHGELQALSHSKDLIVAIGYGLAGDLSHSALLLLS
jgi:hypothetical protein